MPKQPWHLHAERAVAKNVKYRDKCCADLSAPPFCPWKHPWTIFLKPFELPAVANIGLQLVHACEYMHSKQIIHTGVYMYVCACE